MVQRARSASPPAPRKSGPKTRTIGPFSLAAERLLIPAAVAASGALLYLLYGLFSGHITHFPRPAHGGSELTEATQAALINAVGIATKVLAWGALIAMLLALARYYESSQVILATGVVGAAFFLGLPLLVQALLQQAYQLPNALTDIMLAGTRAAGKVLLVVAAARGTAQVFVAAVRRPRRVRVRSGPSGAGSAASRSRSPLRPCWDLDRCRAATGACPRRRQRRSCWKVGSGCLCDFTLAERLTSGAEAWGHEEAAAVRYRAGLARACKTCPIYEEHQEYKLRVLQWLAYPATLGLMFGLRHHLHVGYHRSLEFLDNMMAMLAFTPETAAAPLPAGGVQSFVLGSNVEWIFLTCLWLLLLSYVLEGAEHVTLKWGW